MRIHPLATAALLLTLVAALGSPSASALDCPDLPPPTNFAAEMGTNAVGPVVHLTWAPPAGPNEFGELQGTEFSGWRIEFRDDTTGGAFAPILTDAFWNSFFDSYQDHEFWMTVADGINCAHMKCARPGHTYTFRMFTRFRHASFTCPQGDGSTVHDSVPSAEVQFTIPGPPPAGPTNVRAVASSKKNQVTVTWDAQSGDRFRVERRVVPPGPGAKAEGEYVVVGEVTTPTRKLIDKTADPGGVFEYRVSTVNAETVVVGESDSAYPPVVCPTPKFDLWSGRKLQLERHPFQLVFRAAGPGDETAAASIVRVRQDPEDPPFVLMEETAGKDLLGDPAIAIRGKVSLPVGEFAEVATGSKVILVVAAGADDPLSNYAWLVPQVSIRVGPLELRAAAPLVSDTRFETTVCGSLTAGKVKNDIVPVGRVVAFLFRMVALGPHPLLSGRVELVATVEGGKIADGRVLGRKLILPLQFVPGSTSARFMVAALGPVTPTRSDEASILLLAFADTYPEKGQLRLRITIRAEQGLLEGQAYEDIQLDRKEYVAEVMVAKPKPPAK